MFNKLIVTHEEKSPKNNLNEKWEKKKKKMTSEKKEWKKNVKTSFKKKSWNCGWSWVYIT